MVEIGTVYRHFKGNYYYIVDFALDCETMEKLVVYKSLYETETNKNGLWVRKKSEFLKEIGQRDDNVTGQKTRFALAEDINKDYLN